MSNHQAVIQIVDVLQTPRISSRINENGSITISDYSFEPLLIGITLNLRPRVSADRQWISMEIDATVDAEVDDNAGEVFAPDNAGGRVLLATKAGAASRKVRTFARIPDRTPIIIGGLAAANRENLKAVYRLLVNCLVLDHYSVQRIMKFRRELLIVLTPYVLAEDNIGIRSNSAENNHLITGVAEDSGMVNK
ncbi:hypothetical protein HUE57_11810 [Candidatus Reidiella endopervernicosa]|uniref:Type II/III secretion system secretin-like domain-containing protein n=1 Tax=Candidatus Reidiella endopervernicosa TaxID=2738883 RepID=A0A6N0HWW1_9GAMM|nr:hypothetical protein HUE57_11810 [Candidatus Reidiella endopervernicosa]